MSEPCSRRTEMAHVVIRRCSRLLRQRLNAAVPLPDILVDMVQDKDRVYDAVIKSPADVLQEGSLNHFVRIVCRFTGEYERVTRARFIDNLKILGTRYYRGRLHAHGKGVIVTPEGKNQLLGWGDDPINIAWRDFLLHAYQAVNAIAVEVRQYLAELRQTREQSTLAFHQTVAQLEDTGLARGSAVATVRAADRTLYGPMNPGFASATAAVCFALGLELNSSNKAKIRKRTITKCGSQSFQWEHGRSRNRARIQQMLTGAPLHVCAEAVASWARDHGENIYRMPDGTPVAPEIQAKINYDVSYDCARAPPLYVH